MTKPTYPRGYYAKPPYLMSQHHLAVRMLTGEELSQRQKIEVSAPYDFGEDVTVQTGHNEDGEFILDQCNHAGAAEEMVDNGGLGHCANGDLDWFDDDRSTLVCDKPNCGWQEEITPEEAD